MIHYRAGFLGTFLVSLVRHRAGINLARVSTLGLIIYIDLLIHVNYLYTSVNKFDYNFYVCTYYTRYKTL